MARWTVCGVGTAFCSAAFGGTVLGPTAYLSEADSPFAGRVGWALEDFEDGVFDLEWASADFGNPIGPASNVDSVDGDDGAIDGSGTAGRSFFFSSGATGITITFDTSAAAPVIDAAGLVWTDGAGTITFEAYDRAGNLIGTVDGTHADGSFGGTTAEDRFYGVEHAAGIGSIFIRNASGGIEIDHVQYVVPSPASFAALLALGALRRRR